MLTIEILRGGEVVSRVPVRNRRFHIGRGPSNDLVLTDNDVSFRHAVLTQENGEVRIEDLGSTNGTWVGDEQVREPRSLSEGDMVRLGTRASFLLRGAVADVARPLVVEDVAAGTLLALDSDRFRIGSDPSCDLHVPDGPGVAATLLLDPDGAAWLGIDGSQRALEEGVAFEVSGRRLCMRRAPTGHRTPTRRAYSVRYPYRLGVSLDAAGGPIAILEDRNTGRTHTVTSDNRAVLLFLLARQNHQDRERGVPPDDCGWCDDHDLLTGIWGRAAYDRSPGGFNVLVHRVRREIEAAGFDPWFIEKRRGATRARVAEVSLSPHGSQ